MDKLSYKQFIIIAVLMVATFAYVKVMNHGKDMLPLKPFPSFPKQIGEWEGTEQFFSQEIYDAVGVDDSTLVTYTNHEKKSVQLYIGFYRSQRRGDLIHSPKNCLPGSGWGIRHSSIEPVTVSPDKTIHIIKLNLEKGDQQMVVLYWFHSRGRIIDSEYKQKIYLVLDSIFRNRTDGSFVRLISSVNGEEIDQTVARMKQFIVNLLPVLDEYIPQ